MGIGIGFGNIAASGGAAPAPPFAPSSVSGLIGDWSTAGARSAASPSAPPTVTGQVLTGVLTGTGGTINLTATNSSGASWLNAADSILGRPAIRDALPFSDGYRLRSDGLSVNLQGFSALVVGRALDRNGFQNKMTIGSVYTNTSAGIQDAYGRGWGYAQGATPALPATSLGIPWLRTRASDIRTVSSGTGGLIMRQNGTQQSATEASNITITSVNLGPEYDLANEDIERILLYGRELTSGEIAYLESGLRSLYPLPVLSRTLPVVLFTGNSLFYGYGATSVATDVLNDTTNLLSLPYGTQWLDFSVGGQTTPECTATDPGLLAPYRLDARLTVVCWTEITNDVYLASVSAATAYADVKAYVAAIQATLPGQPIVITTCLPRGGSVYTVRNAVNASLRADFTGTTAYSHIFTGTATWALNVVLADWAADATMGPDGAENNATNYNTDLIHPTSAGYALLAPYLANALIVAGI